MTVRFTGDVPTSEDVLGVTERLYEEAVLELERTMNALKAGEFNEVKAAQAAIRDLRETAQHVLRERGKVDQLRKQIAGHVGAGGHSTLTRPELKSGAAWLASAAPEEVDDFLSGLSQNALLALPWVFEFWALPHQLPPRGAWKTWVIMGGRGAGKTRAGSEWVRAQVEGAGPADAGRCKRVALVGETIDQVRDVMVLGESGIIACSPPDRKPEWQASKHQLVWANGAIAQVFSAHEPETMRGPQFDAARAMNTVTRQSTKAPTSRTSSWTKSRPNPVCRRGRTVGATISSRCSICWRLRPSGRRPPTIPPQQSMPGPWSI